MDPAGRWTLLILFTVMWTATDSEPVEVDCDDPELETVFLTQGESLWFVPMGADRLPNEQFTWYRNSTGQVMSVSTEEAERVHYHGQALCLLNATFDQSGCYLAWYKKLDGTFSKYYVNITVVFLNNTLRLYNGVVNADQNKKVTCPTPISKMCRQLNGSFSWYKDGVILQDEHENYTLVKNYKKDDDGLYDCVCSWTHNQQQYKTTGSKPLKGKEQTIYPPLKILAPSVKEQLTDKGAKVLLNCTVFCGTNVPLNHCLVQWRASTTNLTREAGYTRTQQNNPNTSKRTIVTEILTIERVTARDFEEVFECVGRGFYGHESITVRLKPRQSVVPLLVGGAFVFCFSVFVAVMVKCFAVDLALLFRQCFPFRIGDKDSKAFDAYVVYQLQTQEKPTEDSLCRLVTHDLPHILEQKCGYRLFIHGRDDVPGEDRLELVEERIRKSRRLIVILTPGSGSEVTESYNGSALGGYDWQVGLHQALVQRDLSVILIQLGDTGPGGYSHLPPGLQHLIQRSAPLRWPQETQAARMNSRFWKRVRYLMPATPVNRYPLSTVI